MCIGSLVGQFNVRVAGDRNARVGDDEFANVWSRRKESYWRDTELGWLLSLKLRFFIVS